MYRGSNKNIHIPKRGIITTYYDMGALFLHGRFDSLNLKPLTSPRSLFACTRVAFEYVKFEFIVSSLKIIFRESSIKKLE